MAVPVGLGGAAGGRLLPESIPFRFFGTAVLAHILVWLGVVATAEALPGFVGGAGPVLATLHLLTIGVLLMTAIGASLQMLPVMLARPAPSVSACNAVFALVLAGGALTIVGFGRTDVRAIAAGALVTAVGTAVYAVTIARLIAGAHEPAGLVLHVRAALASLAAALVIAAVIALNYHHSFLGDPLRWAFAHATLAAFGFMGLLALGFATVLIPMFAMANPPAEAWITAAFWTLLSALASAVAGIAAGQLWMIAAALVAGLLGTGLHLAAMARSLAGRMRRRLGPEFLLIRAAWLALPVALALGFGLVFGFPPGESPMLFIAATLFGWLLTLLVGVLQRILPFLASMHSARAGGRVAAPAKLTDERALRAHRWCHAIGTGGLLCGIALQETWLIRGGGITGALGAVAFAWFAVTVLVRIRAHLRTSPAAAAR
jgi:hypothetical protein